MKLRLAKKIWNGVPKGKYATYQFRKAYPIMIRYLSNHKTPKRLLRRWELSNLKDKILASNLNVGANLREYINNKQLKRKRHERRK